jgi:PAS domain S-box-containing protein
MNSNIDLGMVLLDLDDWRRMSLHRDLTVYSGGEQLRQLGGGVATDTLLTLLDAASQLQLKKLAATIAPDQIKSATLLTHDGAPLEIILIERDAMLDLFYRNISKRMQAQERLALFFRHFLTTPIAILITDPEGAIVDANRSFLNLYGYTIDEVRGRNPRMLKSGRQAPAAYQEMWARISDPAINSWTGELINRKKSGEEVIVLLTISAVRKSSGTAIGYIASALDITRKKQLEQELQASNQALTEMGQLKSDLMAITSHDLKAPINSIISRVRLIQETVHELSPEKLAEHLDRIIDAGTKMTEFINELLDLEKLESGRFQFTTSRVHLDAVLASCVETNAPSAETRGVALSMRTVGQPEPVRVDIVKMEQVFNNLLSNALKFSPPGSQIEVRYTDKGRGNDKIIEISDQGPGIPEEEIGKIFDKYYQVRKKESVPKRAFGTGLGLNIVKSIIGLHNGRIAAANRQGGGCSFIVELPGKGAVSSGKDLAAMMFDPQDAIFRYLEGPLQHKEVSYFIAKNLFEARRITDYERPDVIFVHHESVTAEVSDFLISLANDLKPLIVAIGGQAVPGETMTYSRTLVYPVVDIEIYDVLKELQLNRA